MLHSSPSFSIYTDDQNQQQVVGLEDFDKSVSIGENKEAPGDGSEFSFSKRIMGLIQEEEMEEEEDDGLNSIKKRGADGEEVDLLPASPPMYLAAGLGIDASGLGGGYDSVDFLDEKMVDESSTCPSLLRNYVQSLWSEGKLHEAEEHCYQATLANSEDGETLMQYAQLVWELHHDQAKASSYFERAANVAPSDSHILAARAKFLWDLEHDEEDKIMIPEEENRNTLDSLSTEERIELLDSPQHHAAMIDVPDLRAADISGSNMQEYYEKMLEENPVNPLLLKNYAQFLLQSKVDLQGAEEYYYRAIQANPDDGEILSEYARLVWDLHHDFHKASNYFERAIEISPTDSYILAAYASFLWETEEHEEDGASKNGPPLLSLDTVVISTGNA